jgi:hypothetical protein
MAAVRIIERIVIETWTLDTRWMPENLTPIIRAAREGSDGFTIAA